MSGSEILIVLVIELVCGAAGGIALGRWMGGGSLGTKANASIGAVGGLALTWLAAHIPGLGGFVGRLGNVADGFSGFGGMTPALLLGVGVSGLLGGVISVAFAAFASRAIAR
jgi:hypothetical protein